MISICSNALSTQASSHVWLLGHIDFKEFLIASSDANISFAPHSCIELHSFVNLALARAGVREPTQVDNQQPGQGMEQGSERC